MTILAMIYSVAFLYAISAFLFLFDFLRDVLPARKLANQIMAAAFLLSTLILGQEGVVYKVLLPVTNFSQALFFFGWSITLVYFFITRRLQMDTFGLVLTPLLFLITLTSAFSFSTEIKLVPYFEDRRFILHVLTAFLAYASFGLSFVGGLLYLIQNRELKHKNAGTFYHKLPPLEILESVVYRTISFGSAFLTIALISGFLWSKDVFGNAWHWDLKFVSSMITWAVYLLILYVHYISSIRGRKIVVYSVAAFCFVLLTFFGSGFFEGGVHNFLK